MFAANVKDKRSMAITLRNIEDRLTAGGLLPEADEFLLLAVLPADALTASSLGAQDVEEDDIGQVNLWMVRGGIERK